MVTHLRTPVRALLLAALLAFAAQTSDVRAANEQPPTAARTTARTKTDAPSANRDDFPLEGALIVVGIVGVVIVLAWVCSRFGDTR
jgi:hypothetical protein